MKNLFLVTPMLLLTTTLLAQPRGGMGGRQGPGPEVEDAAAGPAGAIGSPMMAGGRPMRPEMAKFEMLRGYIDLVDRFARLSRDPEIAGVAAVVSAADLLRQRGNDAAIEYFNRLLPQVQNRAVQRAIQIQLADLYKQAGQADKALEQLDALMKGAPADIGNTSR